MPRNQIAARRDHIVGDAALDFLQERQPPTASASPIAQRAHVAHLVTKQRHGSIHQIGHHDHPRFAGIAGRAVRPKHFEVNAVRVNVQPLVPFALAGDEADLLASVAVGHRAREHLLDHAPLPVVQNHARRDDAARTYRGVWAAVP